MSPPACRYNARLVSRPAITHTMTYEEHLDEVTTLIFERFGLSEHAAIQLVMKAQAAGYFSEAIGGGGALPELWRGRGLALLKLGRGEDGKADLKEYLKRAPEASDKAMIAMMAGGSS